MQRLIDLILQHSFRISYVSSNICCHCCLTPACYRHRSSGSTQRSERCVLSWVPDVYQSVVCVLWRLDWLIRSVSRLTLVCSHCQHVALVFGAERKAPAMTPWSWCLRDPTPPRSDSRTNYMIWERWIIGRIPFAIRNIVLGHWSPYDHCSLFGCREPFPVIYRTRAN